MSTPVASSTLTVAAPHGTSGAQTTATPTGESTALVSEYRRDLRALLEAKLSGEEIAQPEPVADEAPVIDLMEALRASVAAAAGRGKDEKGSKAAARPRKRAAAARKSA